MRVLLLAETDAYFKYAWALERELRSAGIECTIAVIDGLQAPNADQMAQVTTAGQSGGRLRARTAVSTIIDGGYDWTFLLATGPVIAHLSLQVRLRGSTARLASVIPGVALPEKAHAMKARQFTDLFVVHSQLERLAFQRLISYIGSTTAVALTTLPLITALDTVRLSPSVDCIFAAQPSVPSSYTERAQLLMSLGAGYPRVGLKLRTVGGKGAQTHHERFPYEPIARDLNAAGAGTFVMVEGSMRAALEMSEVLVTVSSTAALEAIAVGRRVRIIDDFGVSSDLLNHVFIGSDLLGPAYEPPTRPPNPAWLNMNYFHDPSLNDLDSVLERLAPRRWSLPRVARSSLGRSVADGFRKLSAAPGVRKGSSLP